jgi:hypothetical protein
MIYRSVSTRQIVTKIYRDLRPNRSDWELSAIEWIAEALEFIGAGPVLVSKTVTIPVANWTAALPTDLMHLLSVAHGSGETEEEFDKSVKYPLDRSTSTRPHDNPGGTFEEYYTLNPDYIHTSFETGFLSVHYRGLALDTDGWPMSPDHPSFREAFFWYILKMMCMGGYRHADPTINYVFADQKWKYYCSQARNAAVFPDMDDMQKMKEAWVKLVSIRDRREVFFNADEHR